MENTKDIIIDNVNKAIRNIICIDDEFINPYELAQHTDTNEKMKISKAMYEAMSSECECAVTMLPYGGEEDIDIIKRKIKQKDLLVLDWELTTPLKEENTLDVIDCALDSDVQFICIYTNEPDLVKIKNVLIHYYSGYTKDDIARFSENCENDGISEDVFGKLLKTSFQFNKCKNMLKLKNLFDDLGISSNEFHYNDTKDWYKLYLAWSSCILPENIEHVLDDISDDDNIVRIDGKMVFLFKKNNDSIQDTDSIVSPEHIISTIAEHIVKEPNNIMDGMWLYYSNQFQQAISKRRNILNDISLKAFSYYARKLISDEGLDEFEIFIKSIYKQELEQQIDIQDAVIPKTLRLELLGEFNDHDNVDCIIEDLVKLNNKININSVLSNVNHGITFGDVFKSNNGDDIDYWLCITAKCDCSHPEKIDNNYIFLQGYKCKMKSALQKAEKGYFSFIKDNCPVVIEWKKKLNVIYIQDNIVKKDVMLDGKGTTKDIKLEYICTLKESYVQRMANMAFSDGNRVGISLANIAQENASEE